MSLSEENTIQFTLHFKDESIAITTLKNKHHSLMSLISDQLAIPGFGLCCGMGSCGECRVRIQKKEGIPGIEVQSCGVAINEELNQTEIFIISGY
ncbi:MAG: hypothetical protein IT254_07930 [Chitinophagaceae bacterium]|nr:hypothetical protein [Chitinophagaceae bacterium]MCW5916153.1 hypothetical protein [Ferruginibacter sp.]